MLSEISCELVALDFSDFLILLFNDLFHALELISHLSSLGAYFHLPVVDKLPQPLDFFLLRLLVLLVPFEPRSPLSLGKLQLLLQLGKFEVFRSLPFLNLQQLGFESSSDLQ